MKEFRKTEDGLFICEECQKVYKKIWSLSKHIKEKHNKKHYYDKWLKEESEGLCKICNKETSFTNKLNIGYKNCCSQECSFKYTYKQIEKAKLENHGNKNYNNREKCVQTNLERYGMYYTATQEYKNNMLKKHGVENVFQLESVKDKIKQTTYEHFGVENGLQSPEVREKGKKTKKERYGNENYTNRKKSRQTCYEHYGVESPLQNIDINIKVQKSACKLKLFENTNIHYRGTYELDFLKIFYEKYTDIINAPTIKYFYENKQRYYFPDFYIPSLNLIIEIKNSYLAEKDKQKIQAKQTSVISNYYNYILIINKDYSKFIELTN